MSIEKVVVALGASSIASFFAQDFLVDWIFVPVNVVFAALLGTYCGFVFSDPITPRPRMWKVFFACVIMGCAFTAIVNAALDTFTDLELRRGSQSGLGAVVSCLTRAFVPALMDVVRTWKWLEWIPLLRRPSPIPPAPVVESNPEGEVK